MIALRIFVIETHGTDGCFDFLCFLMPHVKLPYYSSLSFGFYWLIAFFHFFSPNGDSLSHPSNFPLTSFPFFASYIILPLLF